MSMDPSRILIVGAYGQLGKALQAKFPQSTGVDRDSFDMTDWDMVSTYDWSKYDVIINAAAFTNVDGGETTEGRPIAWAVNAQGPAHLAKVASEHNLTLLHISSEYVFDGTKVPHTEDEPFSPLNVYGQSKAAGDLAVSMTPKHYILRITWLIGDGPNFVRSMLERAAQDTEPTVVNDQVGRLTFTNRLVDVIEAMLTDKPASGTYNFSGDGEPASWAEITRLIYGAVGKKDLKIGESTSAEYYAGKPEVARRPLGSALDLSKINAAGIKLHDWRQDLTDYITQEQNR